MYIIFFKTNKKIQLEVGGTPTESENKLYLGTKTICNNLSICDWKYIEEQTLERDETGAYLHDADYYETATPADRLAAIEMALLELAEALL